MSLFRLSYGRAGLTMFISEEEAERRKRSSDNVLTVINKDSNDGKGELHTNEPPVIIPDEIIEAEDSICSSAQDAGLAPSGTFLRKLLRIPNGGRRVGDVNMHPVMRAATAVTAQLVNTETAARTFGTSYHHADELKHGFKSQQDRYGDKEEGIAPKDPDAVLSAEITKQKKQVRDLAFEKLTKALGLITDDKLMALTDPVKLARVSRDLSTIHDKAMPKEERADVGGVHFHVWRPEQKSESDYEQVTVGGQR